MKKNIKKLSIKKTVISNLEMSTISGGVINSCTPDCNFTRPLPTVITTTNPPPGTQTGTMTKPPIGETIDCMPLTVREY